MPDTADNTENIENAKGLAAWDMDDLLAELVAEKTRRAHTEELNRRIIQAMPGGIVRVGLDGAVLEANQEACLILGLRYDKLTRLYIVDFDTETIYENGRPCPVADYPVSRVLATGETQRPVTIGVRRPDGSVAWAVFRAIPVRDPFNGQLSGAVVTFMDITAEKETVTAMREGERNLRAMLDNFPHYLTTVDREGIILYVNRIAPGLSRESVIGSSVYDYVAPAMLESFRASLERVFESGSSETYEIEAVIDGQRMYFQNTLWPVFRDECISMVNISSIDISEIRRLQDELRFQANHDPLTGLMNRFAFKESVQKAIEAARQDDSMHVLGYMDLDQFKIINDTCGHVAGDQLLCRFTFLLQQCLGEGFVLARLGGDEFGLLLPALSLADGVARLEAFLEELRSFRFTWDERFFQIGASIGVVPIHAESEGFAQLLRDADLACFAAKESGRDRIHAFEPDDGRLHIRQEHMRWVTLVNDAIAGSKLRLFAQRIMPVGEGDKSGGCEILARLETDGRLASAGEFIPAVESFDMMDRLDREVLQGLIRFLEAHCTAAGQLDFFAINLSGLTVSDLRFQEFVRERMRANPGLARLICFEITETAAVSNLEAVRRFMNDLCAMGCRFALDDFGAGLSSFSYLRNLPVQLLKVDGSLIRGMVEDDPVDRIMVQSVQDLCRALGKQTVAEHVEDSRGLERVRTLGLDFAQGFGLHRPEPIEALLSA